MSLVSMSKLLTDALHKKYALCYCEAWNLESIQAIVDAAEELGSPIITGFNGGFLKHQERRKPENLAYYGGLRAGLSRASVPLSFLLNETDDLVQVKQGLEFGFNAIMVENQHLGFEDYRRLVKDVVCLAHRKNLMVEAACGHLPDGCEGGHSKAEITDPSQARAFVEETGIDALGVSVGNIHVMTQGKALINLGVLERVRDAVRIPLVLHGGTGIPSELAPQILCHGVAKINFGTGLKQAYLAAVREKLAAYREPMSPHPFLGIGGDRDIQEAGREAVKEKVRELLKIWGSAGKAPDTSG